MMVVGLLRHGEVEGGSCYRGSTDDPLAATGLARMHAAVAGNGGWEAVFSSPLVRCSSFAREYAQQNSLPLSLDARLKEMHFGLWEGRTADELMKTDPDALSRFWEDPLQNTPPEGEPLSLFQLRVMDVWSEITSRQQPERVLVVTHGGVIRVLLTVMREMPVSRLLELTVGYGELFTVEVGR